MHLVSYNRHYWHAFKHKTLIALRLRKYTELMKVCMPTAIGERALPLGLVDEQAVLVHIILLDELGELVGFLGIVERVNVQHLIPRPGFVSISPTKLHGTTYLG